MKINVPEGKTLVALSGGADSVALLRLLLEAGAKVVALHCNFHLRGKESERDEQFVTALCERLGVELHVRHFDTRKVAEQKGISIEMAARELRYQWFEEMRIKLGCDHIAVAHHRDDQAETVLLNLVRGTGLRGLAGMRPLNGVVIRPLLSFSRKEILDYLASKGQDYVTDSTNLEREALRNRLRLDVLPLLRDINPKAVEHICQTAELVASMYDSRQEEGYTLYSLYEWLNPYGFTIAQMKDILRDLNGPSGGIYESSTHRLLRDRGKLVLSERGGNALVDLTTEIIETDRPIDLLKTRPLTPEYAYLDADKLCFPLTQRYAEEGDRFRPFGMKGSRLVSDFLTDKKFSRFAKEQQCLLVSGKDVVWVIGQRSDDRYRVTKDTRRIYCIRSITP